MISSSTATDQLIRLRTAVSDDSDQIASIYNHYILNTTITFEEAPVDTSVMQGRIDRIHRYKLPWIVACEDTRVLGYAYATPWKERSAYRFAAETSVYLHPDETGRGIGTRLLDETLNRLQKCRIHFVAGVIALPNPASIALHEKFGYSKSAHLSEVGYKFNRRMDVGYWQLLLKNRFSV